MSTPDHVIRVYSNDDELPAEAERLFEAELAYSRREMPDPEAWRFVNICAVAPPGRVLGGLHMDVGPIAFGPLGGELLAYVEHLIVRPEHRNHGLGTALLRRAVEEASARGCRHIQFNVRWSNPAAIAVCRKAGFAMTCLEDGGYFVIKPTVG